MNDRAGFLLTFIEHFKFINSGLKNNKINFKRSLLIKFSSTNSEIEN